MKILADFLFAHDKGNAEAEEIESSLGFKPEEIRNILLLTAVLMVAVYAI